ncbi:MAG: hypothetical protein REH79_02280 [Spiroplasma sp.]|nr:hypothetical protein [Spiroplasma sp.]
MKTLQLLLLSTLIGPTSIVNDQTIIKLNSYQTDPDFKKPFYKNLDQNFGDANANVYQTYLRPNGQTTTGVSAIFDWTKFTNSWSEFQDNYDQLTLEVDMEIAFNYYNIKWSGSNFTVPLKNITSSTNNWITLGQVNQQTSQGGRRDATHGRIDYSCWIATNGIVRIQFRFVTWASNNYDNYYFTITTKKVKTKTTFDYNKTIKEQLNQKINNQTLTITSDYSSILTEEHNKLKITGAINDLIASALGEFYQPWKQYIDPYTYNNLTNDVLITIRFPNPNDNQKYESWGFTVKIKINLTQEYWNKNFQERFKIESGKVINPNNPNGEMIEDQPLVWNGKQIYGTTAVIRFDGHPNGTETMKVNGVPIQVIDNKFTFQMTDNQAHKTNEYQILLEQHNEDTWEVIGKYERNYTIKQTVPELSLKWYAWNPEQNPEQKILTEPTLPNGDPNPQYDKEVNIKTGTKTELIWIKHKAENVFPLDPLDLEGKIIANKEQFNQGFLAEGSVSGMGISQLFNDNWINSVQRVKIDEKTLMAIGEPETIASDDKGSYFSESGTYLYIITDQKQMTASKLVIIGQKWQDKYVKFLDVVNNSDVAVPFWSTLQGFHLKNYLVKYKQFNSTDIHDLTFEQVSSYWKEYVSAVYLGQIDLRINPIDQIDLQTIQLSEIKVNASDYQTLQQAILKNLKLKLKSNGINAIYDVDYKIRDFEQQITKLLTYSEGNDIRVTLTIDALDTSTIIRNSTKVDVRNSKNINSDQLFDLSKVTFLIRRNNFSQFTVAKLKQWIIADIRQQLPNDLTIAQDYLINNLDDQTLTNFITNLEIFELKITIASTPDSNKTENSAFFIIINDPDADIAPTIPPDPNPKPKPDSKPKQSWFANGQNLLILSIIVGLIIGGATTIIFFKNRVKKGIGGKKNKPIKEKNQDKKNQTN